MELDTDKSLESDPLPSTAPADAPSADAQLVALAERVTALEQRFGKLLSALGRHFHLGEEV